MRHVLWFSVIVVLAAGCDNKKKDAGEGMATATTWNAPANPVASEVHPGGQVTNPHGAANPHAGMAGANPHAGLGLAGDPHAGMDMSDPHAGMGFGADPAMAAMQPPDPNRAIDKNKFLRGRIVATPETEKLIKPGAILFLAVRPIDKATGEVLGSPLAVERIDIGELPVAFELTEAQAMVAGTAFEGDVVIDARVDGDGEARSKEPGDVVGTVKATIPAKGLVLTLSDVLR